MFVRAFPLSHAKPGQSAAFLIRHAENYLLYLGDTGADTIEGSDHLERLWHAISPLMTAGKVKANFGEILFANARPDQLLFGHLTPRLLMDEMKRLSQLSGDGLKKCPLVITHIKPDTPSDEIKKRARSTKRAWSQTYLCGAGKAVGILRRSDCSDDVPIVVANEPSTVGTRSLQYFSEEQVSELPISYRDVVAAHERIVGIVHRTPILTSRTVDEAVNARVFFKCENFQRAGAFKFRGAYNALVQLPPEQRAAGVVAFSSGNHAQAVALAAKLLGIKSVMVDATRCACVEDGGHA